VIAAVETYHLGFRDRVEAVDVSLPLTRERYTGNWMGAMQARKPGSNMIAALMQGSPRYAVKGIEGLYVAGQWAEAWGGITSAAQFGRKAIQAICKQDGVIYKTKKPAA
jgi:phytoene dehydrogenase-like protein